MKTTDNDDGLVMGTGDLCVVVSGGEETVKDYERLSTAVKVFMLIMASFSTWISITFLHETIHMFFSSLFGVKILVFYVSFFGGYVQPEPTSVMKAYWLFWVLGILTPALFVNAGVSVMAYYYWSKYTSGKNRVILVNNKESYGKNIETSEELLGADGEKISVWEHSRDVSLRNKKNKLVSFYSLLITTTSLYIGAGNALYPFFVTDNIDPFLYPMVDYYVTWYYSGIVSGVSLSIGEELLGTALFGLGLFIVTSAVNRNMNYLFVFGGRNGGKKNLAVIGMSLFVFLTGWNAETMIRYIVISWGTACVVLPLMATVKIIVNI